MPASKGLELGERPGPIYSTGSSPRVLIDTGPLLALFSKNDQWHVRVLKWLETNPTIGLVTTWPVLTEVCAMLARRVHNEAALDVLRWSLRGGLIVDGAPQEALVTVLAISERFADLPFDLADASIAEAAQRLRIRNVLSIDADFDMYRDQKGQPLINVLRTNE
jgi:uncharacterized protein